jgi:hypothetical protein
MRIRQKQGIEPMNESKQPRTGSAVSASYNVSTYAGDRGPHRTRLTEICNAAQEARRNGDFEQLPSLEREFHSVFDRFDREECPRAELPAWRRPVMLAAWRCAIGDWAGALELDQQAWHAAGAATDTFPAPLRLTQLKALSASNIADELRRLDRFDEAVQWAKLSCELAPEHTGYAFVYALCLARAGARTEADRLFRAVLSPGEGAGQNLAQLVAPFEDELDEVSDLPAVAEFLFGATV